jgi:hypothetical protein
MLRRLKSKLTILAAAIALLAPLGFAAIANAQTTVQTTVGDQGCAGSDFDIGETGGTNCTGGSADTAINSLLKNVINVFSLVVGIVAVIMIIIGGFRYIVSGGESSSVSGAKNAILFAIVGLVIVALAQVIVHFVIDRATTAAT